MSMTRNRNNIVHVEYSPQVETRSENKEKEGIHLFQKMAKKEVTRSHDINKDAVVSSSNELLGNMNLQGFSLYETAHVMCSIVDITKDSNLKKTAKAPHVESRTPKKTNSRASLISNGSSGPFAQLKENAEKKRKSIDESEEKVQ